MTSLKIGSYASWTFSIPNGLPQGSLLSVTLYLIYNSNLLLPNPPSLNEKNISIAYIDDVTHLISANNIQQIQKKAEEIMARSKNWSSRYGALFDQKKTNFMLFTRRQQPLNKITIEGSKHTLQREDTPFPTKQPNRERSPFTTTKTISPFPIPPWSKQLTKSQAKEEVTSQLKDKIANNTLVFFSNGSLILGKGGGAAAILTKTQSVKTTYVGGDSIVTNFETELTALLLFQNLLTKHINKYSQPQAIAIFSDSQAALKRITLPKKKTPGQQLTTKIFNNFQCWTQPFPVRLYWFPGHTGIQHNEQVDKQAKEAVSGGTTSHHSLHHISIFKLKQITNQDSRALPKLTIQLSRVKFKTPPKLIIQALDLLEKGPASTIHQLRSEHSPLNAYLYQIKEVASPICAHCRAL
ncbi:hypothetical protein O181_053552 [Austropuccinia psidii MF-1]|uniref:RNase H type-1 domain-containing protein n=1 Tax=Austropuccinia psidii MF-1 TaxID=1389203 RepID=A0A9Q3HRL8_9BASI|nr:hypothetical protein [Austropuccinia psidii MF-1]